MNSKKSRTGPTYAGRIGNSGAQKVDALFPTQKKKTGKVVSSGDKRERKGGK